MLRSLVLDVWNGAYNQGRDAGTDSILAVLHREATLAALSPLSFHFSPENAVDAALKVGDAFAAALRARLSEKKP